MFITQKHLPRRTVLRGLGASIALPLLDAMVPAFAQSGASTQRLGFVYVPHGAIMDHWTPDEDGRGFTFKTTLEPLAPYRERLNVVSGLHHRAADSTAVHSLSPTTWLSGVRPKPTQGVDAWAGVTADQIAAAAIGDDTMLPSMELATEDHSGLIGACDRDYGCIYMNTLSWRTPTTPMPMEINPRKVFERMFGQGGSVEARLVRAREDASILDALGRQAKSLQSTLGAHDRQTLELYLEAVREIERRLERADAQIEANSDLLIPEAPPGIPFEYEDHVDMMFDLLALAWQADITRVFTFMLAREISNRTYTQVGVSEGHHAVSHHQNRAEKMDMNARIQRYHVGALRAISRQARCDPGRRRLAARQFPDPLRQQHEQQQRSRSLPAAERRRRRLAPHERRAAHQVHRPHADDQPVAEHAPQHGYTHRKPRRQHGHDRRNECLASSGDVLTACLKRTVARLPGQRP